jgi:hypothetical protein
MPLISGRTIRFVAAGFAVGLAALAVAVILIGTPAKKNLGAFGYLPRREIDTSGIQVVIDHLPPWRTNASLEEYAATYHQAIPKGLAALDQDLESYLLRRHAEEPPDFPAPELELVLRDSYGVLIYDEDALATIECLTNLPAPDADRLRLLLADESTATEGEKEFIAACERTGTSRADAEKVLPQLRRFQHYRFCRAHAATMASIAWEQAWLRAHYPLSFWLACLNRHGEQPNYPLWLIVEEAKRSGVAVCGPDINRSGLEWSQEVTSLRASLTAIRPLEGSTITAVIEERDRSAFPSFEEFRQRMRGHVPPDQMARLIRAGCFDSFSTGRPLLLREAEAMDRGPKKGKATAEPWPLTGIDTSPMAQRRADEWSLLGFAPGEPLMVLARRYLPFDSEDSRALRSMTGRSVRLAGLVALCGEGSLTLCDEFGLVDVRFDGEPPAEGELVMVDGLVGLNYGAAEIRANKVSRWQPGVLQFPTSAGAA